MQRKTKVIGERCQQIVEVAALHATDVCPGRNRTLRKRERAVRNDQIGVKLQHTAESIACSAGARRVIERKIARFKRPNRCGTVDRTGIPLREGQFIAADDLHHHHPIADPQRRLDRIGDAHPKLRLMRRRIG